MSTPKVEGTAEPAPESTFGDTRRASACPECAQGKCINCAHAALDPETDTIVACDCEEGGHA